jgi:hypothetical protein
MQQSWDNLRTGEGVPEGRLGDVPPASQEDGSAGASPAGHLRV